MITSDIDLIRNFMSTLDGYGAWILYSILTVICVSIICLRIFIITDCNVCLDILKTRIILIYRNLKGLKR